VAVLDATDERAVDSHVEAVAAPAGSVDVSFNLISLGDVQRTPLVDPRGRPHRRDHTFGTSLFPAFGLPPTL
jgi:hypothetical protein